jgi:MFS family permease
VPRALRSPTFRRFWIGSLISNVGVWMQQIALGWLIYDMTRQASWLGTISFVGNLPMFAVGLVGGAIADGASRRAVMIGANVLLAGTASTLALLTLTGRVAIWNVIAIAMVSGTAGALYAPAVQSTIPSLVGADALMDAIALNSVQFNVARTVGPALAGVVYGRLGAAGCFGINAAGFLVMVLVLLGIPLARRPTVAPPPMGRAVREGLGYARGHTVIGPALFLAAMMSLFGFPYIILLPALARDALGLDAGGLGLLMAAVGAGAVLGALALSAMGDLARKGLVATIGAIVFGTILTSFAFVRTPRATAVVLFLLGAAQTPCVASLNTTIQIVVHDGMRGRVMSMMTVILFGFATVGGLALGVVADRIGVPGALAGGGGVIILAAAAVLMFAPALPRSRTA